MKKLPKRLNNPRLCVKMGEKGSCRPQNEVLWKCEPIIYTKRECYCFQHDITICTVRF